MAEKHKQNHQEVEKKEQCHAGSQEAARNKGQHEDSKRAENKKEASKTSYSQGGCGCGCF